MDSLASASAIVSCTVTGRTTAALTGIRWYDSTGNTDLTGVSGYTLADGSLDGEVQVNIPPATSSGQSLRLRGKGWHLKEGRGDLILTPILCLPENWSSEEVKLLRQLQRIRCNDPRESWRKSASL